MLNGFDLFQGFVCQKILPLVYDESWSYLEMLEKLKTYVNEMITNVNSVIKNQNTLIGEYSEVLKELQIMNDTIEKMKKGFYIENGSIGLEKLSNNFKQQIKDYIVETTKDICKLVWFGLTDDGYFYAVIPDSWQHIIFDTDTEGRLILSY